MANPKRVSIKGRGADIFFGDYTPPQQPPPPVEEPVAEAEPPPAPDQAIEEHPSQDEGMLAGRQESRQARKQASPAPEPVSVSPLASEVLSLIWESISERATITNAFRYTDQELSWLTDALYEINKRHKVRLTKQDIARLGLNAVLWDYRVRGDDSLLGKFAEKRRDRKAGM